MKTRLFLFAVIFFELVLRPSAVSAQFSFDIEPPPAGEENAPPLPAPRQFRAYVLGMPLDDLKQALTRDSLFYFRGDRDVSFLPVQEQTLVETAGRSFIRRAFFQAKDGNVFIMAFSLNTNFIDHYSIFTSFVKKYGEPVSLSPSEAVWETEETRVSIERPLTVKYIDMNIFNLMLEESESGENRELLLREEFLGEF